MSKRAAGRELMGPPPVPPKVLRRGGRGRGGRGRGYGPPPSLAERRRSLAMMPPPAAAAFPVARFSHSSSDDEVFLADSLPPLFLPRHPPPFPDDLGGFMPPPNPRHDPHHDPRHDPYFQHEHPGSGESSDEGSMHRVMSGGDEFEYLYRYGYRDHHVSSSSGSVGARSRVL